MSTFQSRLIRLRPLGAALALCLAPALAVAGNSESRNAKTHGSDHAMNFSGEARDAYRAGQIWGTYLANPTLESYDIDVRVQNDTAILTGEVDNFIEKRLAARIAQRVDGIHSVRNELRVEPIRVVAVVDAEPGFADFVADATTEAMIDSKLLWNSYTDGLDIDVAVLNGMVTLSGAADTPGSKALAGRIAADTPGVVVVNNHLSVDSSKGQVATVDSGDGDESPSDTWIAAKVDSTLRWSTGVDADSVQVDSDEGVVKLSGSVDSVYQKELAIELAQNTRGVQRVDASALDVMEQDERLSQR